MTTRERKVTIPAGATAKQILKAIDTWATRNAAFEERAKLWRILTALRGPDESVDQAFKYQTTGVIRRDSLPSLAKRMTAVVAAEGVAFDAAYTHSWHFHSHAVEAYRAIHDKTDK
jgi:hypothetical protein